MKLLFFLVKIFEALNVGYSVSLFPLKGIFFFLFSSALIYVELNKSFSFKCGVNI